MGKLLINIKSCYPKMSKTEKRIADYLFENANNLAPVSITELSKLTDASEATIVRFAKRVGCVGYQQFKLQLAKEEKHIANKSISKDDGFLEMYQKVCDDVYASLIKTRSNLSNDVLEEAYKCIINAERIYLMGVGNSYAVCLDAYHKLSRIGLNVHICFDSHFQIISACEANERSTIIVVSHSGYTRDIIESINVAKANNAKVVVITSDKKSPAAKLADVVLPTSSDEINYRILGLSSRYAQLAIFDTLYSSIVTNDDKVPDIIENIENTILIKRVSPKKKN